MFVWESASVKTRSHRTNWIEQYEVGRYDFSLVHNSGLCIYRCIRFSVEMENEEYSMIMNIHFQVEKMGLNQWNYSCHLAVSNDSKRNAIIDLL